MDRSAGCMIYGNLLCDARRAAQWATPRCTIKHPYLRWRNGGGGKLQCPRVFSSSANLPQRDDLSLSLSLSLSKMVTAIKLIPPFLLVSLQPTRVSRIATPTSAGIELISRRRSRARREGFIATCCTGCTRGLGSDSLQSRLCVGNLAERAPRERERERGGGEGETRDMGEKRARGEARSRNGNGVKARSSVEAVPHSANSGDCSREISNACARPLSHTSRRAASVAASRAASAERARARARTLCAVLPWSSATSSRVSASLPSEPSPARRPPPKPRKD